MAVIAVSLALACSSTTAPASTAEISIYPSRADNAITEGETTLAVDPDTAYAAATDYARWTTIFPDLPPR